MNDRTRTLARGALIIAAVIGTLLIVAKHGDPAKPQPRAFTRSAADNAANAEPSPQSADGSGDGDVVVIPEATTIAVIKK